jgi:drug/metabolite transporter (DMT)-like permease
MPHSTLLPSLAVFFAAGLWGLYWWPLREVEAAGVSGLWSVMASYLVPLIALLPVPFIRRRQLAADFRHICLIGVFVGAGLALYACAFLYTSVMRTTLLFYLTPVWSTLLGIIFLAEKPGWQRWGAMAIGFAGLCIMMLAGTGTEHSQGLNVGDLAALAASVMWAVGSVLVRRFDHIDSLDILPAQYFFAALFACIVLSLAGQLSNAPTVAGWSAAMPWLIGYFVVVMLPSLYVCIRGAQLISPGRVGILMMSEVLVAGISAPLLAGEVLSGTEWLAGCLIILAGVLEVSTPGTTPARAAQSA